MTHTPSCPLQQATGQPLSLCKLKGAQKIEIIHTLFCKESPELDKEALRCYNDTQLFDDVERIAGQEKRTNDSLR
jgi:hypothetical protein